MLEAAEAVIDVGQRRPARLGAVGMLTLLGQQVGNPDPADPAPQPELPGMGVGLKGVMPEVFGHGRPPFPKRERQATVEKSQ